MFLDTISEYNNNYQCANQIKRKFDSKAEEWRKLCAVEGHDLDKKTAMKSDLVDMNNKMMEHTDNLRKIILDNKKSQDSDKFVTERIELWFNAPICFAELLLNYDFCDGEFIDPSVNKIIKASKCNKMRNKFMLTENENGHIYLEDSVTGFRSSRCIAVHVSSGSYYFDDGHGNAGYRYVNFLTQSGSVYWGSGVGMDKKSLELLSRNKIYLLLKH